MNRSIKWGATLVTTLCCASAVSSATVTIYTDKLVWQEAVGEAFLTEDFSDEELNPGVSYVSTESGHINPAQECYQDVLASQSQNEPMTTWIFEFPVTAYGADWTLGGPGGSGNNLLVYLEDGSVYVGSIPNSYGGEFWGFVSDMPFSSVRVVGGSGTQQQHYCMDDMVYVPEFEPGHVEPDEPGPVTSRLSLRVPSPYGIGQTIRVTGDGAGEASAGIFDTQGRQLRNLVALSRGSEEARFSWDGRTAQGLEVPASALFVRVASGGSAVTRMFVLLP